MILCEVAIDEEYITTPYKKKKRKKRVKKADHPHQWDDCVYGLAFAGNFELSIGTYFPICGKVGVPTFYTKWKQNTSENPKLIRSEWKPEALREFDEKTRTLPYFNIELFTTKYLDLEGKSNENNSRTQSDS